MQMKIIDQWVKCNEKTNQCYKYTKYEDGRVEGELISTEEAAKFAAEFGGY